MIKLICKFEFVDDDLQRLIDNLDSICRLCSRNSDYIVDHSLKIEETNTLKIKIYKNDRINQNN